MRDVLLLGCGSKRDLLINTMPLANLEPTITTLDHERRHNPDVVWDLNVLPWPFVNDAFDEVHAYEVLEHLGQQGDARSFFDCFWQIYRILKPGGHLAGSCPQWNSMWAWGDPSHTRVINRGSFTFLDQTQYAQQVGKTAMSDFRSLWHGDFEPIGLQDVGEQLYFLCKAHKPARA
jgi:SAM-dependent methyltransferase